MKKILTITLAIVLASCKSPSHSCDSYGHLNRENEENVEFDIHKVTKESQSKYVMSTIIK